MKEKKMALLEKRIEEFCDDSVALLKNIHEKHSDMEKGKSKQKKKKMTKIHDLMPNPDIDLHEAEQLEEAY